MFPSSSFSFSFLLLFFFRQEHLQYVNTKERTLNYKSNTLPTDYFSKGIFTISKLGRCKLHRPYFHL